MSFADPQSVTVNAVAKSMPRISSSQNSGEFALIEAAADYHLGVQHTYSKTRVRRTIRLDYSKISADTFYPTQNVQSSMSCWLTVNVPVLGFTVAEQKYIVDGLVDYLDASSGAKVTQFLGGEN